MEENQSTSHHTNYGAVAVRSRMDDDILNGNESYNFSLNESYSFNMINDSDIDPMSTESTNHQSGRSGATNHWATLRRAVLSGNFLLKHDEVITSREEHAQGIKDEIRDGMKLNLTTGAIAIITYMLTISIAFWLLGYYDWTLVDSCYFAVETFTTIGYGDLVPDTPLGKLVTCVYGFTGVATLGVYLGVIGHALLDSHHENKKNKQRRKEREFLDRFFKRFRRFRIRTVHSGSDDETTGTSIARSSSDTTDGITRTSRPIVEWCGKKVLSIPYSRIILYIGILVLMSYLIGSCEGWTITDTAYYSVMTACTIGFGDYAPQSQLGRLYAIVFMPLAVGATGYLLGQIADSMISRRQTKSTEKFFNRNHTLEDLDAMDLDGDGQVTWADFLEFMLLTMDKIDKKLIETLRANFDKMDLDHNGAFTKEDLVISARLSLMKPSTKLSLREYKRKLTTDSGEPGRSLYDCLMEESNEDCD